MLLRTEEIAALLKEGLNPEKEDPFVISPTPDLDKLEHQGAGAIDLRLGTWFLSLSQSRMPCLDMDGIDSVNTEQRQLCRYHYVHFGEKYYLHPGTFVLGTTLEWLRLPRNLFGYVVGKSTLGRRGLVIATATAVHHGFTGCLTLELANIGEIPVVLRPGILVCQLSLHQSSQLAQEKEVDCSQHIGKRRAELGCWKRDSLAEALARAYE
jgi:dCTP deaminase